jgi:DeoR/GlpR family transcriptional regulator of sugar metabolism
VFAQERFRFIIELLSQKQRLSVRELERTLKVSSATLRRDLAELEKADQVVRVHGGIVHPSYVRSELSFDEKSQTSIESKRLIAKKTVEIIPERSTVFVDSGTTCLEVAKLLFLRPGVSIVTNSIPVVQMAAAASARVVCLGGEVRSISGALVGGFGLKWLENFRAEWAIIGASGVSSAEGMTTTELGEASIKQQFIKRSQKRILVADSSKWNQVSTVQFADWSDVRFWVTDHLPSDQVKILKKKKVQIL